MVFSKKDEEFMKIALDEAKKSLTRGEYPVGAVLAINDELIGKGSNKTNSSKNWSSHAESDLISQYSNLIRKKFLPTIKDPSLKNVEVVLYTTLEPCLMCLGTAILNRVTRIVYASKDPHGGATLLSTQGLPEWYSMRWPKIEGDLFGKLSRDLLIKFMAGRKESYWVETLRLFREI